MASSQSRRDDIETADELKDISMVNTLERTKIYYIVSHHRFETSNLYQPDQEGGSCKGRPDEDIDVELKEVDTDSVQHHHYEETLMVPKSDGQQLM